MSAREERMWGIRRHMALAAMEFRKPQSPFDGRKHVLLLLRNFKVQELVFNYGPHCGSRPVAFDSFDAVKKWFWLFRDEFGTDRIGMYKAEPSDWVRLTGNAEKCWLALAEDVAYWQIPPDFVVTEHDKPLIDVTEEEALMSEDQIEKAKKEFPKDS